MWDFLTSPANALFTGSLVLLVVLFLFQLGGLLSGLELTSWFDSVTPDLPEADVSGNASGGFIGQALGILHLGRVPLLVSFAVFLFAFGAVGLLGQYALAEAGLSLLPLALASPLAFLLALPLVRWSNTGLARILPRDESAAVSDETFIGRVATITIGRVTSERQSEARLTGPKGRVHYIQVVADDEGAAFQQGDEVLVVGRRGTLFTVIAVTLANLHDA